MRSDPPRLAIAAQLNGCSRVGRGYGDVTWRAIFGHARPCCGDDAVMTRRPQPIGAPLLGGDAPSDAMRWPCCGEHVRRPFCLFGHVTPHGPILACLDAVTSAQPRSRPLATRHQQQKSMWRVPPILLNTFLQIIL